MASRKRAGVNWYYDSLTPQLAKFAVTANVAIIAQCRDLAADIKQYMQENAPWQDRTGDARRGLWTQVDPQGFRVSIDLGYSDDTPYGLYLEVRWGGFYSIIVPTLEHFSGRDFWQEFDGIVGRATRMGGFKL